MVTMVDFAFVQTTFALLRIKATMAAARTTRPHNGRRAMWNTACVKNGVCNTQGSSGENKSMRLKLMNDRLVSKFNVMGGLVGDINHDN